MNAFGQGLDGVKSTLSNSPSNGNNVTTSSISLVFKIGDTNPFVIAIADSTLLVSI
jgi:hypothetical protein